MHYYQFNIGDYAKHTRHLTMLEDLAYRRLIDQCYMTEKPLPIDVKKLSRLIGMPKNTEEVSQILEDFFFLEDEGYFQKRIADEIGKYHAKADSARVNGKKGGRPKKAKANPEESESEPKKTQSVNFANPEKSESKAKHKPLTINQETLNNKDINNSCSAKPNEKKSKFKFNVDQMSFAKYMFDCLKELNPNQKEPNFDSWANDVRLLNEVDKRDGNLINQVWEWARKDSFWSTNILSPAKLRKQFDALTLKMNEKKPTNQNGFSMTNALTEMANGAFSETGFINQQIEANHLEFKG